MLVEGRLIYDMMDSFWPDARADESVPDYLREYGGIWTDKPKVLVSRTRRTASRTTRAGSAVRMPSICSPNFGAPATATSASAAPRSPPHCARAPARRAAALHAPGCARRGSPARRRARRAVAARSAPAEIVRERRDDAPLRGTRRARQLVVVSIVGHQTLRALDGSYVLDRPQTSTTWNCARSA